MFLDTQNQFRDQEMSRAVAGQTAQLNPGYSEAYAEWTEQNKEVLYTWSAEERTKRFTAFLQQKVQTDLMKLIEQKSVPEEEKKILSEQAKRGQLLLVSRPTREGDKAEFNTFLTPQEAAKAGPGEYLLLSPTLRSGDFKTAILEQTLLHVVSSLEDNFKAPNASQKELWRAESAYLKNGVIHVEVVRSAFAAVEAEEVERYEIEVNEAESTTAPLVYEFINKKGEKKHVPEAQLPEKFGQIQTESNLAQKPEEFAFEQTLKTATEDPEQEELNRKMYGAGLATWATVEVNNRMNAEQKAKERAAIEQGKVQDQMGRPMSYQQGGMNVPNVVAAKAAIAARMGRQSQAINEAQNREQERYKKAKKIEKVAAKQTRKAQVTQKKLFTASQKSLLKGTGIAAGIAGLGGTTLLVTHLTLFT